MSGRVNLGFRRRCHTEDATASLGEAALAAQDATRLVIMVLCLFLHPPVGFPLDPFHTPHP